MTRHGREREGFIARGKQDATRHGRERAGFTARGKQELGTVDLGESVAAER